jgi:NADH-quinone oxidoreductase subunit G
MPTFVLNGQTIDFEPGDKIIQAATRAGIEIPYYCYHDGLSIPAQCRICLAEIWAPNPRNENKLEPMMGGKLQPTCSDPPPTAWSSTPTAPRPSPTRRRSWSTCSSTTRSTARSATRRASASCRTTRTSTAGASQPLRRDQGQAAQEGPGPHVYIYSDRCIMCTRCVRFAREVPETGELMIDGRGNKSQIDVFPGEALDNELSANVIDLCPVGALLDKDFLFTQRVWFLKSTPSIDGITASGDNIWVEHNEGKVYRFKPRTNLEINKWWITDEVRYGWKFVHSDDRIRPALPAPVRHADPRPTGPAPTTRPSTGLSSTPSTPASASPS